MIARRVYGLSAHKVSPDQHVFHFLVVVVSLNCHAVNLHFRNTQRKSNKIYYLSRIRYHIKVLDCIKWRYMCSHHPRSLYCLCAGFSLWNGKWKEPCKLVCI